MKKFLPKSFNNPSGFTLIELLVVVSIIAILAVIAMVIFSGVQRGARDARRQADVLASTKAFEANKVSGSTSYPLPAAAWWAGGAFPADTYVAPNLAVYSIVYSTATGCTSINRPTIWLYTSASPTAAGGAGTCTPVTSAALSAAPAGIVAFQVCALLETGANPANIFCVPNAQ